MQKGQFIIFKTLNIYCLTFIHKLEYEKTEL